MTITGNAESMGTVELNSKSLSIYPNPVKDYINIFVDNVTPEIMEISNLGGQVVYSSKYTNATNLNFLPNGVYILKIIDIHGKTFINKFMKK